MCICVHEKEEWQQWTRDTNKKKKKRERERERERGGQWRLHCLISHI